MKRFVLILIASAFASTEARRGRIYGGQDATAGQFPFIVAINDPTQYCDGSIIAPNWILTAAHCLFDLSRDAEVYVGSHRNQVGGTAYAILEVIPHEDYDDFVGTNDIGLVKIDGTLEYSDLVQAIEFADSVGVNATCTAAGWGITESVDYPEIVQFVELTAIDLDTCLAAAPELDGSLGPEQICTLAPEGLGTCYGDSGGPLICGGKLAGIVSYGITVDCATATPEVFTRPVAYTDWIQQHTQS